MDASEIIGAIVTLITGIAGTHLVNKRQERKLQSSDRQHLDSVYKQIIDRLEAKVAALEAKVDQLSAEHLSCHEQLAELRAQVSNDNTLRDWPGGRK